LRVIISLIVASVIATGAVAQVETPSQLYRAFQFGILGDMHHIVIVPLDLAVLS
jgi:hypothetical protein